MPANEVNAIIGILTHNHPDYNNPDNADALFKECKSWSGIVTMESIELAFHRLQKTGRLKPNKEVVLEEVPLRYRSEASASIILDRLFSEGKTVNSTNVREVFGRVKHLLATNEEAYQEFSNAHPEIAVTDAFKGACDEALVRSGEALTAENLEGLLHPGHPHSVRDEVILTDKAAQEQADAQERARLVKEISQGRSTYFAPDKYGRVEAFSTQGLDEEPLKRLREIAQIVSEYRRLKGLTRSEAQTERQTFAAQERKKLHATQYKPLPEHYQVPGKDVFVEWSYGLFSRLPSSEKQRLLEFYGNEALTAAFAAKGN